MPRRTRLTAAGLPHLIEHRGHNGSAVFNTTADRRTFLDAVVEAAFDARCAVHGYALLVDRLLLLCTPEDADGVPRLMQDAGRRYVRYFNTAHGRSGALWDGRYRSCWGSNS